MRPTSGAVGERLLCCEVSHTNGRPAPHRSGLVGIAAEVASSKSAWSRSAEAASPPSLHPTEPLCPATHQILLVMPSLPLDALRVG